VKNELFYFGSYEYTKQNYNAPRSAQQTGELNALATELPQYGIVDFRSCGSRTSDLFGVMSKPVPLIAST
jgi:hypothetical protein